LLASGSGGKHRLVLKTIAHKHFTSRQCNPKLCVSKSILQQALYWSTEPIDSLKAVSIITYISSFMGFVVYGSTLIFIVFLQLQVTKYWNMS